MNIFLDNYGRFGNYILEIIRIINKYQLYKNNKEFKIYLKRYKTELSELFSFPMYNFDSTNQNKDDFIVEKPIWKNYDNIKNINETLLQKNVNNLTLYYKPNSKYLKVQYDNIIHLRLDDYLNKKFNKMGYYCLDDQYLTYISDKYNLNKNNCCIITSNIKDYNRIYKNRSFNVYSNSLLEDFTINMSRKIQHLQCCV